MFLRDLFKKRFNKSRNTDDWQKFTKLKNEVNSLKHVKKREFYTQKLDETRKDIKGTWKVPNNAMGKKSKSAKINSLKVHGKDISDPTATANVLNSYFCATAERIQNEDPSLKDKENTPSFEAFIKK